MHYNALLLNDILVFTIDHILICYYQMTYFHIHY
jgi:hypothetical protein